MPDNKYDDSAARLTGGLGVVDALLTGIIGLTPPPEAQARRIEVAGCSIRWTISEVWTIHPHLV